MQQQNQVKVSIVAELDGKFKQAFMAADKQMSALGKTAQDLNKKVSDIGAFRKQQNAVKDAGRAWLDSKNKLAALKREIGGSEQASNKQLAALRRAEAQVRRTSASYNEQRSKLTQMNSELQRSGVNVGKLSGEYKRLQTEITKTTAKQKAAEQSLIRQQKIVSAMEKTWRGIGAAARGIGATAAGAMAGGAVASVPISKAMSYEQQLAYMASTAAPGKDIGKKRAMEKRLSDVIEKARVDSGGAKREDVASALSTMIAGGMSIEEAIAKIPMVSKASYASGSSAEDLANIALRAGDFGMNDTGKVLDMAMRSGQMGGVELRNLAKGLPGQMSSARSAGYSGEQGFANLLSLNQVALKGAADPDQAMNNVKNLLDKLGSEEFAKNVKDETGVDWTSYAMKKREKGIFGAEAFAQLAEKQVEKDPAYKQLQARLKSAGSDAEKKAILTDMGSILSGSNMGKFIQDRQALGAGLQQMYARKDIDKQTGLPVLQALNEGALASQGTYEAESAFISEHSFAAKDRAAGALDRANELTYQQISGPLNSLLQSATGLAQEFPKVTTAAYGAAVAMAAVAATGVVGGMVMGRKGGKPPASIAAPAVNAAGKVIGSAKTVAGKVGTGGAFAAAGGALDAYMVSQDDSLTDAQKKQGYTAAAGGAAGGWAGAQLGAAAGAFGGPAAPITVPLGALIGGTAGYFGGSALGDWAGGKMFGDGGGDAAKAAADAATAASQAATAAQNRPNITSSPTYNVTVNGANTADGAMLQQAIASEIRKAQRENDSMLRSNMSDTPGF